VGVRGGTSLNSWIQQRKEGVGLIPVEEEDTSYRKNGSANEKMPALGKLLEKENWGRWQGEVIAEAPKSNL